MFFLNISYFMFLRCSVWLPHLLVVVQSKHSVVVAEKCIMLDRSLGWNFLNLRRTQLNPSHSGGSKAPVSWQVIGTKGVANLNWDNKNIWFSLIFLRPESHHALSGLTYLCCLDMIDANLVSENIWVPKAGLIDKKKIQKFRFSKSIGNCKTIPKI